MARFPFDTASARRYVCWGADRLTNTWARGDILIVKPYPPRTLAYRFGGGGAAASSGRTDSSLEGAAGSYGRIRGGTRQACPGGPDGSLNLATSRLRGPWIGARLRRASSVAAGSRFRVLPGPQPFCQPAGFGVRGSCKQGRTKVLFSGHPEVELSVAVALRGRER
jgi:hypothetical protein